MNAEELKKLQAKNTREPKFKGNWVQLKRYWVRFWRICFLWNKLQRLAQLSEISFHKIVVTANNSLFILQLFQHSSTKELPSLSKIVMSVSHTAADCWTTLHERSLQVEQSSWNYHGESKQTRAWSPLLGFSQWMGKILHSNSQQACSLREHHED